MDIREYVKNPTNDAILHPWESARIEVVFNLLKKQISQLSGHNIVDIGCGDAKVIDKLSKRLNNSNFIGLDTALDDELIEQLDKILNNPKIKLFKSSQDIQKHNNSADIVLLLDIIEHIENDVEFVSNIVKTEYINSETKIVITVPAFQRLYVNRDKWLGHYRRYTNESLKQVALQNKLKIIESGYFFSSLIPIRFLQKLLENKDNSTEYQGINNWRGSNWSANVLKKILIFDYYAGRIFNKLGLKIPGLSCYMICKKQ